MASCSDWLRLFLNSLGGSRSHQSYVPVQSSDRLLPAPAARRMCNQDGFNPPSQAVRFRGALNVRRRQGAPTFRALPSFRFFSKMTDVTSRPRVQSYGRHIADYFPLKWSAVRRAPTV